MLHIVARCAKCSDIAHTCYFKTAMDSYKRKISGASSLIPSLTSKKIVLSEDMILYMSKFLNFKDYRSFIQALWPNKNEKQIFRDQLWKMSTYRINTKFLNTKRLIVEYNYDPARIEEVLFNVETMLPIFGGIVPPFVDKFLSVKMLVHFVRMHVHVNMCMSCRYASCSCYPGIVNEQDCVAPVHAEEETCEYGHFHHFCSHHVIHWIKYYLETMIISRHTDDQFGENSCDGFLDFIARDVSFRGVHVHLWNSLTYRVN